MERSERNFWFAMGWLSGFMMGWLLTMWLMDSSWELAAVHGGHAEYYLDEENHNRQWRWLPVNGEGASDE